MLAVVYGSSTGNTQEVAEKLAEELGGEALEVSSVAPADLAKYSSLIFGTSTWGSGDLQDDWEGFDFDGLDLNGKVVALFGLGDSSSYGDTYCDAMGQIYEAIKDKGAKIIGSVSTDGYEFEESRAVVDGKFVGLALDNDNQGDLTDDRIAAWVESIKPELA